MLRGGFMTRGVFERCGCAFVRAGTFVVWFDAMVVVRSQREYKWIGFMFFENVCGGQNKSKTLNVLN